MESPEEFLERSLKEADDLQSELSQRWRKHANRRTIIVTLICGTIAIFSYVFIIQPPDNFPTGQLVSVDSGASLTSISQTLEREGVVRNAFVFKVLVAILGRERGVHAGDYLFKQPENIFTVARAISIGAYGLEPIRIRIPEGTTMKEMARIYTTAFQRFNADAFLAQTGSLEGYLFPDTYFFLPNATENTVISAMRQNFDTQISTIDPPIASSTHSLSDIVKMASIIEKEAPSLQDRKLIAGVLWHRLSLGMPLQSDVTLIYATGKTDSSLTTADLLSNDPFNTYTQKGLPPTPIDNPSLESIEAAANPTKTSYLYYLADKSGVTHYAKTYQGQLQNQRLYLGN